MHDGALRDDGANPERDTFTQHMKVVRVGI